MVLVVLALLTTSTLPMALAEDASIPHRPLERLTTATPLPALRRWRARVDSYRWCDSSRLESPKKNAITTTITASARTISQDDQPDRKIAAATSATRIPSSTFPAVQWASTLQTVATGLAT